MQGLVQVTWAETDIKSATPILKMSMINEVPTWIHLIQAKDYSGGILESNRRLEDRKERETKLEDKNTDGAEIRVEEEEAVSSGRIVEGVDEDEVFSPAPLTVVPPRVRSSQQAEPRGERVMEPGNLGRREAEVASGLRTAPTWKCRFFPSEVSEGQLREWHQMYRIPDDIEFVVPGPNDRADDPPLGTVALNQAILAAGLRLPFPRVVRKFLWEWGIAPTQLCPNGWRILIGLLVLWDQLGFPRPSIGDFHSLYSFKSDGKRSGWWYASVKVKTGGSVVTQTPDSIKNLKKFWFFVRGPWQFAENDAKPDLSIPVRYHELRYVAREPTEESSERARRARDISENLRSSAVLITEENLISARLSPSLSALPISFRSSSSS
ncbi:Plus3 domain-containing protein [Abeliophyllum distichum]|uniref:Plus3 domain-containing protein n=1 Tax=Abeliophyllum distichum TaxID=126358 RepID=A0ABD1RB98_9LAMI